MTSPATYSNSVRHIDVSDVIAADFRLLPDGHVTTFGEGPTAVKAVVGNGSVGRPGHRRPRSGEVRSNVEEVVREVADDVMSRCDGRGCGRHDDGFSGCEARGKISSIVAASMART